MATNPGILTDYPWKPIGNYKYLLVAPFVVHSIYSFITKDDKERDWTNFLIFPFMLSRMLHNQIWISFACYKTAKGDNRIVDKPIEFEQVDRERDWDDNILLIGITSYLALLSQFCCMLDLLKSSTTGCTELCTTTTSTLVIILITIPLLLQSL